MRILQATDSYPPPLVGGRERSVRTLAHELHRRGHDVEVVALAGPGGPRTEWDGNIRVHSLAGWSRALSRCYADPRKPFHPTVPDPGLVGELVRLIRRRQPDLVNVHSWMLNSFLPFLPSRRTRLVVTMHEYGLICPKTTFVHEGKTCDGPGFVKCVACAREQYGAVRGAALTSGLATMRNWYRRVDRYIAVSPAVARPFRSALAAVDQRVDVVPPFLTDDCFEPADTSRPDFVPAEGDYVMFAGALSPHKGIDVLLEAWSRLVPSIPLVLAGLPHPGAPSRFPRGVFLVTDVSEADVLRAWRHCTVAVVPSCWPEPFGLVALEAMAAGRPVVASRVGGLADLVVDGVTGMLIPPGDASVLQDAVERLLVDPLRRAEMGRAGRLRAAAFSAANVVPQVERIYEDVVSSATRAEMRRDE